MNKRITGIIAAAAIATFAYSAVAMAWGHGMNSGYGHQGGHMMGAGYGQHGGQMMGASYNNCPGGGPGFGAAALTPEQQETFKALFADHQQKTASLHQELRAKGALLEAEFAQVKPDNARIDALTADVSALRVKLLAERIALRKAVRDAGLPDMGFRRM